MLDHERNVHKNAKDLIKQAGGDLNEAAIRYARKHNVETGPIRRALRSAVTGGKS